MKLLKYLLRESAVARRRSSIEVEEEEGKTPRFMRHCKPLRSPKRRFSGADPGGTASEVEGGGTDDDGSGNG